MKHLKTVVFVIAILTSITNDAQSTFGTMSNTDEVLEKENPVTSEVVAEIIITDSKTIKGYKNLNFKLSNGISFTYEDGNSKAGYKNRALEIKGKYSVNCEVGTLSLAFNANDGSIWWIFRSIDELKN